MVKLFEKIRDFFGTSNLVLAFEEHKRSPRAIKDFNDPLVSRILFVVNDYRAYHLLPNIGKEIPYKNLKDYAMAFNNALEKKTNGFIDGVIEGLKIKGYDFPNGIMNDIKKVSNLSNNLI